MSNITEIWSKTLDIIQNEVSNVSFETWIKPLTPVDYKNSVFTLCVEHEFFKSMIVSRYKDLISNCISQVTMCAVNVNIILNSEIQHYSEPVQASQQPAPKSSGLNPKYTFDNYVVGAGNRFAHAASLSVAETPAHSYNPLFLHGSSGLGKTHLMHAIGNYISASYPSLKVRYVSSELFTNDLINSIKENRNEEFRNKYRQIDVFLIDDIQFIGGKSSTEEEFFHTFNHLYQADKQIIISSDRHPKEMNTLEERLRSRFEWGLICDIQPPDYETRLAILQKKLQVMNADVPEDVLDFIARKVDTNVRELEGTLTRITAYSQLNRVPINMSMAENVLQQYTGGEKRTYTFSQILNHVADYFDISPEDLISKRRTKELVYARNMAMYICRNLLDYPFTLIGSKIKRDHSTVMNSIGNIEKSMKIDYSVKDDYNNIIKSIQDA